VLAKMYGHRFLGIFSKKHRRQADETRAQLVPDRDADSDPTAPA
jgi:hypothetical protein